MRDEENVDDDTWQEAYEVLAIKVIEEDDEVFYDCEEPIEVEVGKTGCSTFDLTSCPDEKVEKEKIWCMIMRAVMDEYKVDWNSCTEDTSAHIRNPGTKDTSPGTKDTSPGIQDTRSGTIGGAGNTIGSRGEELVMTTQSAVEESSGNFMWMFAFTIVLATLGALSLCQAVRAWIHEWFNKTDDPEVIEEQEMKQVKSKLSKVLSDLERKEDELMMQRKEIERLREEVNEERKEAAETREELQEARDELEQLKDPARSGERWKEIAAQEKEKAAKAIDVASGWRAKGEESKVKAEAMMAKAEEMMAKAVTMRDEAQSHVRKELKRIRYKVEGLEWTVSQSGDCYHAFGCKHAGQRRTEALLELQQVFLETFALPSFQRKLRETSTATGSDVSLWELLEESHSDRGPRHDLW
ncbi:unnamed protein product [Durusdinium trenchii]|uniref:Uncharacterized protein n=1 Tax=Durusdinium trenchii TaxID=1381693 RepID=A0ABP0RC67_9DINO